MDLRRITSWKKGLVFLAITVLVVAFLLTRPDINSALSLVDNSWAYPKDDWRVSWAADYLIWTKHPRIYDALDHHLWACHVNPENEDHRAEISAYILGSVHTDEALGALRRVFDLDLFEGFSGCEKYVWEGLKRQGSRGYAMIEDVAAGNVTIQSGFRQPAIRILGETGESKYVPLLADLVLNDSFPRSRYSAVLALANIGTPEALEYIEIVVEQDLDEDVREVARQVLEEVETNQ